MLVQKTEVLVEKCNEFGEKYIAKEIRWRKIRQSVFDSNQDSHSISSHPKNNEYQICALDQRSTHSHSSASYLSYQNVPPSIFLKDQKTALASASDRRPEGLISDYMKIPGNPNVAEKARVREPQMVHSFGLQDRRDPHRNQYDQYPRLEQTPDNTLVHDPDEMDEFCDFLEEEKLEV